MKERNCFALCISWIIIGVISVIVIAMQSRAERLFQQKAWRDIHKEYIASKMREWRSQNRGRIAEYTKQYRAGESYQRWKREYDKRYYEEVVRADSAKLDRSRAISAQWANDNKDRRWAIEKARRQRLGEQYLEAARAAALKSYHAKPEEERKALRLARAEYQQQWREVHKDDRREYGATRHAANRAEFNRQSREYYEQNKLAFILRANARRVLLTGTYTQADIDQMYIAQGGKCAGCVCELGSKYEGNYPLTTSKTPRTIYTWATFKAGTTYFAGLRSTPSLISRMSSRTMTLALNV